MRIINLPERLKAIASCIDERSAVADIGTDHGYLPVYLAQTRRARRIIASDVSSGSLSSARRNAAKYGVTDKIEFVHAPGLDRIAQGDADTIVIAGVGGETILAILEKAPWTLDASAAGKLKLILQPQTKLDVLRNFMHDKGYKINNEISVTDRRREYTILIIS